MSEEEMVTYTLMCTLPIDYCSEWQEKRKRKKEKGKRAKARKTSKQAHDFNTLICFLPLENHMEMAKGMKGRKNLHWTLGILTPRACVKPWAFCYMWMKRIDWTHESFYA